MDLDAKRISGIVIDEVYASYVISHKSDPLSYHEVSIGYPKEEFAVGIRKGDKKLRLKINRALKELKRTVRLKKLIINGSGKILLTDKYRFGLKLTV